MSRQNPVRRLSEELEGLINLYLTLLLLFLLCVAAVSFHHGIAITFPNRHLPVINNRVSICLALPSTSRIDLARVTPRRPNSKTSQSLLHTPRCVSSLRRASQPDLSWFFPSIHHPDSASASSGFLTITPTSLSHSLPAPAFSSLFSLSTSSNSYSQTTTQHHLLLHSLALTSAHSLASVLAPDSSFSLLLHFHRHHLQPCRSSHSSSPATASIAPQLRARSVFRNFDLSCSDCMMHTPLPSTYRTHTSWVSSLIWFRLVLPVHQSLKGPASFHFISQPAR